MDGLTSGDMFIVVILISIILVLGIIIVVLDILNKKSKLEDLEIDRIFDMEKDSSKLAAQSYNTPSKVEEIRYVVEDEELEKTKAKLELMALREELEKQKEQDNLSPLAESIEEDIFNKKENVVKENTPEVELLETGELEKQKEQSSLPSFKKDIKEEKEKQNNVSSMQEVTLNKDEKLIKDNNSEIELLQIDEPKVEKEKNSLSDLKKDSDIKENVTGIESIKIEEKPKLEQVNKTPFIRIIEDDDIDENSPVVEEITSNEVESSQIEEPVSLESNEPIKYNFDKMVSSVKLDDEDKKNNIQEIKEEEINEKSTASEKINLPIEEINEVSLDEKQEEKYSRIIEEEPIVERVNIKPNFTGFNPVKIEKLEIQTESFIDPSSQIVPEIEIQEVAPTEEIKEEKTVGIEEIASNINEDLKEEKQANLARMNEIQQDLNEILNNKEYEIAQYEDMQEKSAIISVEELTKLSNEVYDKNEDYQMSYEDEGNEPISIKELEKLYNTTDLREVTEAIKNEPTIVKEEIKKEVKEPIIEFKRLEDLPPISSENKFKSTPFISPVFGLTDTPTSLELEQTANLDKLNDEIKKTNEFLSRLKELQKNLD